jgi:pyruvate formate lyase activating enzyme
MSPYNISYMEEARFYEKLKDNKVQCHLCPHECVIAEGKTGICTVRKNQEGTLYSMVYNRLTSEAVDPIEKKPLYHFHPGNYAYSIGTVGCNLSCDFCQNWQISQGNVSTYKATSDEIVTAAIHRGCEGIAYTYNEPSIWYEFVYDTGKIAKNKGLYNVLVTNGYIKEEPLKELLPLIDAMNIDVKAFTEEFYKDLCHGKLSPVLKTAEIAKKHTWVELTTLLIPGKNDSDKEIINLVEWVATTLGVETPLHFSRYFPHHKLHIHSTPVTTLEKARDTALKTLRYVYIGNVWGHKGDNTYCYNCGEKIIVRKGFSATVTGLKDSRCTNCGASIDIVR